MTNVGFCGGSSVRELGSANDMLLFFNCIRIFSPNSLPEEDWSILTERLYRRYIRKDEMELAVNKIEKIRSILLCTSNSASEWTYLVDSRINDGGLDFNLPNLGMVFNNHLNGLIYCIESAELNHKEFSSYPTYKYEPVRTVVTDLPWLIEDMNRPLMQYDNLSFDDTPYWLRQGI